MLTDIDLGAIKQDREDCLSSAGIGYDLICKKKFLIVNLKFKLKYFIYIQREGDLQRLPLLDIVRPLEKENQTVNRLQLTQELLIFQTVDFLDLEKYYLINAFLSKKKPKHPSLLFV